jgi:D-arginine dehydrogenase
MYDVVIVGAGIAGASLAYFLGERGITNVLVLERETQAGYHASGRSAATLVELDPIPTVQDLKVLGARFFHHPPQGFSENPVLERRGVLSLFRDPQWSALCQAADVLRAGGFELDLLQPNEANRRAGGVLVEGEFAGGVFAPQDGFLDVHELLASYMKHARRGGASFRFGAEVDRLLTERGRCRGVVADGEEIVADWVVNAAGAWAQGLAERAGALPIRFAPLRRSIVVFPGPLGVDYRDLPLVWSEPHQLYFRPETTGILFSPMDEEPMAPCDARPDDVVIAAGLERLRVLAPSLVPRTLGRRWAGLRTFSPDRVPVVGEDPRLAGFFWLAGQGGCGIETSPALGRIAADLMATGSTEAFDAARLAPDRFAGKGLERLG